MTGPCGISFCEIRAYLDESEIEGDHRRRCVRFIQALDVAYLNHCYEKINRATKKRP
jgi:hypothetical protein